MSVVLGPAGLVVWIILLALFFAKVEIQIEGEDGGWAANLPTWRIEKHWLLDIFWGGRAMTGYHAWVFTFIALIFHLAVFITGAWTLKIEARIIGSLAAFWITEDFLWFVFNPAFGISRFKRSNIPWHKRWFLGMPIDYWYFGLVSAALLWWSYQMPSQ